MKNSPVRHPILGPELCPQGPSENCLRVQALIGRRPHSSIDLPKVATTRTPLALPYAIAASMLMGSDAPPHRLMPAPVIWVTGTGGLIGNTRPNRPAVITSQEVVPLTRPKLDLIDLPAYGAAFRNQNPALIIHCAA